MKSLVIFTLALVYLSTASALDCYQCSGPLHVNSDCENLNFIPLKTCHGVNNVCASYVVKTPGNEIMHRVCATENICSHVEAQYAHNPAVSVSGCRVCGQNGCNSA